MSATEQKTQTWYRVWLMDSIDALEVVNSTDKTVTWIDAEWDDKRRRSNIQTSYERWFANERDAVEYLRARISDYVSGLRSNLAKAEARLAAFNAEHPED